VYRSIRHRRQFVLHIGTHKTATKSLQTALSGMEFSPQDGATLYPTTGRRGTGHHNLAWGLLADERFDPKAGSFDELGTELEAQRPNHVIVSSEDFEYLHRRRDTLDALRHAVRALGFEPCVVVVLRDAVSYAESLYWELAHHGLTDDFEEFARRALADGGVVFKSHWDFRLDYEALVGRFIAVFGQARVVVLPYDPRDMVGMFARRVSTMLGVRIPIVPPGDRLNARGTDLEITRLIAANQRSRSSPLGSAMVATGERLVTKRNYCDAGLEALFIARFADQVERLARRHPARSRATKWRRFL